MRFKIISVLVLAISMLWPMVLHAADFTQVAPTFSLLDTHQNVVKLDSYQGKVVLITFWAIWCRSCLEKLPELDDLQKKFESDGFVVLSVCVKPPIASIVGYLQKHPVSFPVLIDQSGEVADSYRLSGFPAAFLIGRDGLIRHQHLGYGQASLALYQQEILDLLKL